MKQNSEFLAPILIKSLKDKVANVKFYTIKLLQDIIGKFDGTAKDKIRGVVKELTKDADVDVKYYANQFLER